MLRPPPRTETVTVSARTQHLRGWILVALGIFQLWLWGTRIANLLAEVGSFPAAFVAVHLEDEIGRASCRERVCHNV